MGIASQIREIILANPAMYELVGTRVYPLHLPDKTSYAVDSPDLPAIHYGQVSHVAWDVIDYSNYQYQFTVTANNYDQLKTVSDALIRCLHRYKSGNIRYIGFVNSTDEWDNDTLKPYSPMTFKINATEGAI